MNTYKTYSTALSCLSRRYISMNKIEKPHISNKKDMYKYYDDRLREDISPLKLVRSLPALNHYVSLFDMTKFTIKYILSYRFFFIYMARTTFQAVRPLMAFCVFGELMKLILATMTMKIYFERDNLFNLHSGLAGGKKKKKNVYTHGCLLVSIYHDMYTPTCTPNFCEFAWKEREIHSAN
ncbi:conserved Plasmodium protein, unknown function [Plasmodium ovale curtisi]|uniref:Uncharacterized protein n=1 Tax=Plasmodium ovale curtisi TaxID=864141 RepID=A0A1A8VQB9_PLAOA|nr:conserved Plasmodium protein, unknown function [Plasmodium ovale curtisi]